MTGKILIVDNNATNRITLKVKFAAAGYQTVLADSARLARLCIREETPGLILLGSHLADRSGSSFCQELRHMPETADLPILLIVPRENAGFRMAALRAGASEILAPPIVETALLAKIRSLLRFCASDRDSSIGIAATADLGFFEAAESFRPPARIACIADTRETTRRWKTALAPRLTGNTLLFLDRDEARLCAESDTCPDLFVLAAGPLHRPESLLLLSDLRSRRHSRLSAICVLAPPGENETRTAALDLGANEALDDQLERPACAEEIAFRLQRQLDRKRRLDRQRDELATGLRLAATDPLTGLYNRRYALPHMRRIAEMARRENSYFAIMLLDLDRFKSVNDSWGHFAGDAVLIEAAHRLRATLGPKNLLARIGGEEFLAILPGTPLAEARHIADTLRHAMQRRMPALAPHMPELTVTVSIGLAIGNPMDGPESVEKLIDRADRALFSAKAEGRNQVTVDRLSAA